jgi:predicted dehydrogenase
MPERMSPARERREVRVGVIGLGAMGSRYARMLLEGRAPRASLAAVCNRHPEPFDGFPGVPAFTDSAALIRSGTVDAVLIATPHFAHTDIGIDALSHGLHILLDKPISVHKADAERLVAAHRDPRQVFAVMFQMRTDPRFARVREWLQTGALGRVLRFQWTITDWFRTDFYYRSSSWRATWAGEGGGVLLNQAPHQLDLLQWLFGLPRQVRAWCGFGKYHAIEVEDEVTAYLSYPDGATGVFLASTGEAPGTNRLEIAADHGRVVVEGNRVVWDRSEVPVPRLRAESAEMFARPPMSHEAESFADSGPQHPGILRNFVDAILDGAPLIAAGAEGVASVELANAMILSAVEDRTVDLPLDAAHYAETLRRLARRPGQPR